MIASVINWQEAGVLGAVVALFALAIVARLVGKDRWFSNVKVGFFIERRHGHEDEPPAWTELPPEFEQWLINYLMQEPPDELPGDEGRGPEDHRPSGD